MKQPFALAIPLTFGCFLAQAAAGAVFVITNDTVITSTNVELQGHELIISNSVATFQGAHTFARLQVLSHGKVTHLPGAGALNLTVTGDVFIASSAKIIADGIGGTEGQSIGSGRSSGVPLSGSGGGHGGNGGMNAALAAGGQSYGSYSFPLSVGGGGGAGSQGPGGSGGGSISLVVTGTLQVDGLISANGADGLASRSGGGAGGSIYLKAAEIVGHGAIVADGGNGEPGAGGGGGGGRIALEATANEFSGKISAHGGAGFRPGGAGTVFLKGSGSTVSQLRLDNGGRTAQTVFGPVETSLDIVIDGKAIAVPKSTLSIKSLRVLDGSLRLTNRNQTVTVTQNAFIERTGRIDADRANNSASDAGTGRSLSHTPPYTSGGGGHGGYGGAGTNLIQTGGGAHGSLLKPVAFGGAGGGAPNTRGLGGGAVRLTVNGLLLCNGTISADGGDALEDGSGGGAGGSVWLTVGSLAGSGAITANGGNAVTGSATRTGGGGGGGGRIALYYGTNLFAGRILALGGDGLTAGGAGTIYTAPQNSTGGAILADNGGLTGTNTLIAEGGSAALTVQNGAIVELGRLTFSSLNLLSNGWISLAPARQPIGSTLSVTGSAFIDQGSGIRGAGAGYGAAQGPGRGSDMPGTRGGGAGYGGFGGSPPPPLGTRWPLAGQVYGSITSPGDLGSGGSPYTRGGPGGGSLALHVAGTLILSGTISVNGLSGTTTAAGGGSGGSLNLDVGVLAGSGTISANGGNGTGSSGGGGGGRIAIQHYTNLFAGTILARGGAGAPPGGPGTVYLKNKRNPSGLLLIENGGLPGPTLLTRVESPFDLRIRDGAQVWSSNSVVQVNNLSVGPGGSLLFGMLQTTADLRILHFGEVQPGGHISADGAGFPMGAGPGAGVSSNAVGSGAGYGGRGGASSIMAGGSPYGAPTRPNLRGSGGGRGAGVTNAGSAGGGALRIDAGQALVVDGGVTANGQAAYDESAGGGSGGSVWITTPLLFGTGFIEARGGAGELLQGGGGAGGRVAVYSPLNAYLGSVDVTGGTGFQPGAAGTVVFSDVLREVPESPSLAVGLASAQESLLITWHGTPGATYRAYNSVDLVHWLPCEPAVTCTTATQPLQIVFPIESGPRKFYQIRVD